jgi:uroporphyrin-3 C-methyltransferase
MTMTNDNTVTQTEQSSPTRKNGKLALSLISMGLLLVAGAGGYSYFHLNQRLSQQLSTTTQMTQQMNDVNRALLDLQQANDKSQSLAAEQEKIIADWKRSAAGDLEKWRVAESFYLVKLANDHLQFSHNTQLALTLLQRADAVLQEQSHDGFLDIRQSIAADIARIQAAPKVNVTDTYLALTGLDTSFNQLPLPYSPLKQTEVVAPRNYDAMPWWKATWLKTWDSLRKVIIVRNTTQSTLPLVLPDEKPFLYQNMHAQMESVMWALLAHNDAVYHASLTRLIDWVATYFDQDAAETKTTLEKLKALQALNIEPPTMNVSPTLELFDRYL